MSSYNVSTRYAKALIDSSTENNTFGRVVEDIELVHNSLRGSREFRSVLASPVINKEKKISIINEIFSSRISGETMNFLKFVIEKNREEMLIEIIKRFIELKNDQLGILVVDAVSSLEMNEKQKEKLKTNLEKKTGNKISLNFVIDEKIIGGFKLKLKDTVIDASVKYQLEKLRKSFADEKLISNN